MVFIAGKYFDMHSVIINHYSFSLFDMIWFICCCDVLYFYIASTFVPSRLILMSPVLSRKPIACSTPRRTRRKISGQLFSPIYELPISESANGSTFRKSRIKPATQGIPTFIFSSFICCLCKRSSFIPLLEPKSCLIKRIPKDTRIKVCVKTLSLTMLPSS